jgi:hypothetical protein
MCNTKICRRIQKSDLLSRKMQDKDKECLGITDYGRSVGFDTEHMIRLFREAETKKGKEEVSRTEQCRSGCGNTGHNNKTNMYCPLNVKNIYIKQEYYEGSRNSTATQSGAHANGNTRK